MNNTEKIIKNRIREIQACNLKYAEHHGPIHIFLIQYQIIGTDIEDMMHSIYRSFVGEGIRLKKFLYKYESYKYYWMNRRKQLIKLMVIE